MHLSGTQLFGSTLANVRSGLVPVFQGQNERWPRPLGHEEGQVVKACPSNKALSIGTAGSITPVDMQTIKIASIENGVREH